MQKPVRNLVKLQRLSLMHSNNVIKQHVINVAILTKSLRLLLVVKGV